MLVIVTLRESGYGKQKRDDPSRLLGEYPVHMQLTQRAKVKVKGLQLAGLVRVKKEERVMYLMLLVRT